MMPSKKNKKFQGLAFNTISILDLFMLATFVFAMNADVADKKYQRQYKDQLSAATNETSRLTGRLTDVTDKLAKAETELGAATNETARLTGRLTDVTDKLAKAETELGAATNKNAELNEKFSKLKTEFDNLKDSHAKLDKLFQDYSAMLPTNAAPLVYASVCCLGNKRVFWKNNQEWSCCSGESGDQIEDFLKTKSIREEVKVHVNFIRFYDCAERENGIVALLQGKYQKENVSESSASGCHLIDMRDANNIYLDWKKTPVTLDKLEKELGLIAEGESDEKGIKYFMACPKSNNEEDRIRGWLNNAYGHPVEFEVMYY